MIALQISHGLVLLDMGPPLVGTDLSETSPIGPPKHEPTGQEDRPPSVGCRWISLSLEVYPQFTEKKKQANAFDLRYGNTVEPKGPGWELCERSLARRDVVKKLSEGW
jgi:hypothetical protein